MAATRTLPPCRLSAGLVPVRLRQYFTYERISPQPPLVEPIEHLKKRENCNVEQKGAPLPPKSGSITFLIFYEGGKGGTLLRARFFSCDTNSRHLHFHNQYLRTRGTGGVQPASLYNDCFSRKQADAQSGGSAKRYRSDCS